VGQLLEEQEHLDEELLTWQVVQFSVQLKILLIEDKKTESEDDNARI
jgi:hypothetical protein